MKRQAAGNDKERHVLGIGLCDAGEGILDAGSRLRGEHAVLLAALDAGIAVGNADADALLPAEDRADVDGGARFDDRIARITRQEIGLLALENFGNDRSAIHGLHSPRTDVSIIGPIRSAVPCANSGTAGTGPFLRPELLL